MPEEFLSNPNVLAAFAVAAVFLFVCGGAAFALGIRNGPRARLRKRVAIVIGGAAPFGKNVSGGRSRRHQVQEKLKEIEGRRTSSARRNLLRRELMQAGLSLSLRNFALVSVLIGILGAVGSWALGLALIGAIPLGGGARSRCSSPAPWMSSFVASSPDCR